MRLRRELYGLILRGAAVLPAIIVDFTQNYFQIFELPVAFDVDADVLADRYLALQKEVHPDRFAAGTNQEKRLSMQWAAMINAARETLGSPLPRAIYMLQLKGVTIAENPVLSPEFLGRQIALRERLESIAEGEGDADELERFREEIRRVTAGLEAQFGEAIGSDLAAAEQVVYELQFIGKLLHTANRLEEKLLDY